MSEKIKVMNDLILAEVLINLVLPWLQYCRWRMKKKKEDEGCCEWVLLGMKATYIVQRQLRRISFVLSALSNWNFKCRLLFIFLSGSACSLESLSHFLIQIKYGVAQAVLLYFVVATDSITFFLHFLPSARICRRVLLSLLENVSVRRAAGGRASHFGCKAITQILLHLHLWNLVY